MLDSIQFGVNFKRDCVLFFETIYLCLISIIPEVLINDPFGRTVKRKKITTQPHCRAPKETFQALVFLVKDVNVQLHMKDVLLHILVLDFPACQSLLNPPLFLSAVLLV